VTHGTVTLLQLGVNYVTVTRYYLLPASTTLSQHNFMRYEAKNEVPQNVTVWE